MDKAAPAGLGLEAASRKVLLKLMRMQEFQELWTDLARKNQILDENVSEDGTTAKLVTRRRTDISHPNEFVAPSVHFLHWSKPAPNALNLTAKIVENELRQFVQAIRTAVDAFADGSQMARFEDQLPAVRHQSHEPAALYTAHVHLERFCASEHFHAAKFGLAARQIANLLRALTQRVSSIYSVERCSFLADSLFRLLSKFYECVEWHRQQRNIPPNTNDANKLGAAIKKFGTFVCRPLRKMLTKKQLREEQTTAATHRRGRPLNWQSPAAFSVILIDGKLAQQIQRRQRGFLLSTELDYDRRRLSVTSSSTHSPGRTQSAESNRWENKTLKSAKDLLRSAGPAEIAALREMCKLTLEYIEERTADGANARTTAQ